MTIRPRSPEGSPRRRVSAWPASPRRRAGRSASLFESDGARARRSSSCSTTCTGRGHVPRSRRAHRRLVARRTDPALAIARPDLLDARPTGAAASGTRPCSPSSPCPTAECGEADRAVCSGAAALEPRLRTPDRRGGRRATRCSSRSCISMLIDDGSLALRDGAMGADDRSARRCPFRPASKRSSRRGSISSIPSERSVARACVDRGQDLPSRGGRASCAAASLMGEWTSAPRRPRPPGADPARPLVVLRRRGLPVPACADPGCRVRRDPEGDARGPPRAVAEPGSCRRPGLACSNTRRWWASI